MRVPLTLAGTAAVLCALPLLDALFESGWVVEPALAVLLVGAVGLAARMWSMPAWLVHPAQAAAVLFLATARYAADTAVLGMVPTVESFTTLTSTVLAGRVEMAVRAAPVALDEGIGGIALILLLGAGVAAIAVDLATVTLRVPALTGVLLLALLTVPLVVDYRGVGWLAFALAAGGFVLLLAVDGWQRARDWGALPADPERQSGGAHWHVRLAARVGAVALACALVVPAAVPGLATDSLFTLASGTPAEENTITTPNPLVSMRRDLTSLGDQEILRYRTAERQPEYLRMHVLSEFDGTYWTMAPVRTSPQHQVADEDLPTVVGRWDDDETVETTVQLERNTRLEFLPLPYPPARVDLPEDRFAGDWFVDPDTHMIFTVSGHSSELSYTVNALVPSFTRDDLADASPPDGVDERYLALPGDLDPAVLDLTHDIVADAAGPHEAAVELQNWFTGGRFRYSLDPLPSADNEDPLTDFLLNNRVGYCEQFAGAMAVMARIAGIPARVAVGYTSGEHVSDDLWRVTGEHAHAWPELYFEGYGWLRFEPTPSSGDAQGSANTPSYAYPVTPAAGETDPGAADDGEERPEPDDAAADPEEESTDDPAASPEARDIGGTAVGTENGLGWWPALVTAAALVLLCLPAAARSARRGWRWWLAVADRERANAAWAELRDDVLDLRLAWDPAESPRGTGRRLARDLGLPEPAREALRRIVLAEERARYAPEPDTPRNLRADSHTVREALRAAHDRPSQLRARLLPYSVLRVMSPPLRRAARRRRTERRPAAAR